MDNPDWSDAVAKELLATLGQAINKPDELRATWQVIGLRLDRVHFDNAASVVWVAMAKEAHASGKLVALIEVVADKVEAQRERLESILSLTSTAGGWYVCTDRFSSRLVGPGGRRVVFDRSHLRSGLRQVVYDDHRVFAIHGTSGTGKTHSRHLIDHVVGDPQLGCDMVLFEVERQWSTARMVEGVDAVTFAAALAERLGMPKDFDIDRDTDEDTIAGQLTRLFVQRYAQLPQQPRWLFVDGLDRAGMGRDVHVFISNLASEVDDQQLGAGTKLIVTGHPGDFSPDVMDVLVEERIDPIGERDLQDFFGGVARDMDQEIADDECAAMASDAVKRAGSSDLRALARVAREMLEERYGKR